MSPTSYLAAPPRSEPVKVFLIIEFEWREVNEDRGGGRWFTDDYREEVDELVSSRGTTISPGMATLKVERTASSR